MLYALCYNGRNAGCARYFCGAAKGMGFFMGGESLGNSSWRDRNFILFTITVFASFAILGIADNIRGTALPRIQEEFLLSEMHLGLLLAVNASGYLAACTFTAALARKIGMKACHVLGMSVIASSGLLIAFTPSFGVLLPSFFILNAGFGMMDISVGVIAARIFTRRTGTMMNLAHFFYGAGAVFSPIISTGIMAARFGEQLLGWRNAYLIILSFALLPVIPAVLGRLKKPEHDEKKTGYPALLRKPAIWLLTLILALGLAGEIGSAAWLVNFLETAYLFSSERAAMYLTLYFVCFTLGRLVLGPLIDKIGFINSLAISMALSGAFISAGVLLGEAGSPLLFIAGVAISPLFPTVMAVIAKLFADVVDLAMTAILTAIGVVLVPLNFLIGGIINEARLIFTDAYGDAGVRMAYQAGYLFVGLCCFGAFASALILRAKQKKAGMLV